MSTNTHAALRRTFLLLAALGFVWIFGFDPGPIFRLVIVGSHLAAITFDAFIGDAPRTLTRSIHRTESPAETDRIHRIS